MPIGFAYFIYKIEHWVDRSARYISTPVIEKLHDQWIKIIHGFLVVYTNLKPLRPDRDIN